MSNIQIAIDGPASSGKSTLAKRLAKRLHYVYLDTGAMYRCVTYLAQKAGVAAEDTPALRDLVDQMDVQFVTKENHQEVYVNQEEVTQVIRQEVVSREVSLYSALPYVREALVAKQQAFAQKEMGVVMDGRDIGTVVLKEAQLKIFLTASPEERGKRRYLENQAKGYSQQSLEEIIEEIKRRDDLDRHRSMSPLQPATDAIILDSSHLDLDQVEEEIMKLYEKCLK
ncbi:(d)CMP kinase [Aerococcus christensenii]|uniref:Cytidylate kinase n=1 Tax=Aerococcus christensenii TaxID=87541 RepID=A0A133Y2M7_9LACT|nr:(d)CMP kinase [Aerococcus christensenii]KXB37462.1 cytidylate kinase [Aerococcus christensenii]MDK8233572.1 (d)CMP kinase [Aerococcus christensenii]WEB70634.1 (d)CMP kinase [Aerococcus christensenii]